MTLLRLKRHGLPIPHLPLLTNTRRILTVMTPIQRTHQLRKHLPHKLLVRKPVPILQLLDITSEISIPAVFHIQMQIMRGFEMFAMAVLYDVGVAERLENAQFGVQLILFFVGHAAVGDFFAAEDLAG